MRLTLSLILLVLALLIAVPLLLQRRGEAAAHDGLELVIFTPHNDQIRYEFEHAFSRWHEKQYGEPVRIAWLVPGGTTDARRMLEAQYRAALRDGEPLGGGADLFFGGGSFEHDRLKAGVSVIVAGEVRSTSISIPVDFTSEWLDERYGENSIGSAPLYDPDRHWFGLALSGFGIISNAHLLDELEALPPKTWADLGDPRLAGWVALGNPAQSGSMRKALDTVLQFNGWEEGCRIVRRMSANARYFSASASTVPIDVAQGSAAAGTCIDFYGRLQSQVLEEHGYAGRVIYIDPAGETVIDPDPISMLRGAPHPHIARRFIEFCLSLQGQALWQFPVRSVDDELGPARDALRRLPIRRAIYEEHLGRFADAVNPYQMAQPLDDINVHYWSFIPLLVNAMAVDRHERLAAAWRAIRTHPAYPTDRADIVAAPDISNPTLRRMLELFDAMPSVPGPNGRRIELGDPESLEIIRKGWLEGGWAEHDLWPAEANPETILRELLARQFVKNYDAICAMADE